VTPHAFLAAIEGCFERAAARAGLVEREALVAGLPIRFRVAGKPLATSLFDGVHPWPAAGAGPPAAVLSAFDSESGGEVPPPPPWSRFDYRPRDEVAGFTSGRWRAAYSLIRSALWFHDTETGRAVGWTRATPAPDARERAVPWWTPLHWALPANGRPLVHGAAVGGVLLVGPGGSGKSTTACAAAAAGLPCAGDDYVAVEREADGGWRAHALYRWARLDARSLRRLPSASPVYDDGEKSGVEIATVDSLALRAVVVPRVAARTGTPRPISPAEALRALAPSTLIQTTGGDPGIAASLARLVRSLPTLSLEVGPDLDAIPAAVERAAGAVPA
jgi:hypothetical protein